MDFRDHSRFGDLFEPSKPFFQRKAVWLIAVVLVTILLAAAGMVALFTPTTEEKLADCDAEYAGKFAERPDLFRDLYSNCLDRAAGDDRLVITRPEVRSPPQEQPSAVSGTTAADACVRATGALLEAVATGLLPETATTLSDGYVVAVPSSKRNTGGWPSFFFSAQLSGPGLSGQRGVWAVGANSASAGPIWAVDGFAREFSDWGAAAAPGSQADQNRQLLATYSEAEQAAQC